MNPLRSGRAWLPAAVAAVSMALGLIVLQVLSHLVLDDRLGPRRFDAPVWDWLGSTYVGYFGVGAFDPSHGKIFLGTLIALALLLVIGFLGSWWAIRGIAPGSSVVPAFLSVWMVLVVATALASLGAFVVRLGGQFGSYPTGQPLLSVLTTGIVFGVKWGWIAALLAALLWLLLRPAPTTDVEPGEDRPSGAGLAGVVPEGGFVLKRQSDFPDVTHDSGRAVPAAGPAFAADPGATPEGPAPEPDESTPDVPDGPAPEPDESTPDVPDGPAPEPEDSTSDVPPEESAAPYVGKYSTASYDESPPDPEGEPPSRPRGSHRRDAP